jgi:hypothetical protein
MSNSKPWLCFLLLVGLTTQAHGQLPNIILGRPTDTSITASVQFTQDLEFYLEYGTQTGTYNHTTPTINHSAIKPDEVELHNLFPNTRYYYRVQSKLPNKSNFTPSPEYNFHTQRPAGSSFTFTIEADEHLYDKKGVANMYKITLANQAKDKPDFMLSLGDIFGDDHYPFTITTTEIDALHKNYRPFLGAITHSIPFYVCLGNHEGEMDYYLLKNPGNNLAHHSTYYRKYYYPNPYPNGFYSGNTNKEPYGIDLPENYYAWTWGDALFVVMDVYRDQCDTSAKPGGWAWSLGKPQYDWLKATLEGSTAKHKLVFAHHVSGQGRGGVVQAKYYEWGGLDKNNTNTFSTKRPGWGKPIHQLFVDNGVDIFFQGHDHVFAHEIMDGVTYQEVPMPSDSTYMIGKLANADAYISDTLNGTGHIRVTVSNACIKVDYIKAYLPKDTLDGKHKNGEVAFSYTVGDCSLSAPEPQDISLLKIKPNPAQERFLIQYPSHWQQAKFSLLNAQGRLILNTLQPEVDIRHLPAGMYYLIAEHNHEKLTQKLMIQHP